MVKGQFILKCLIANHSLKSICKFINLPYKYTCAIATGIQNASSNVITGLSPIILPLYWYEEADEKFCTLYEQKIKETLLDRKETFTDDNSTK